MTIGDEAIGLEAYTCLTPDAEPPCGECWVCFRDWMWDELTLRQALDRWADDGGLAVDETFYDGDIWT